MSNWRKLLLMIGLLFVSNTYAQNSPIACQDDAAGGLSWIGGRWQVTSFSNIRRFILVLQGKNLTKNSASKAIGGDLGESEDTICRVVFGGRISCSDDWGEILCLIPRR
jgi:hypothetical protein